MTLSNQTTQRLAIALTPEVIDYIYQDERWIDFIHEIIPDAIQEKIGNIDNDLLFELGMKVMENLMLKAYEEVQQCDTSTSVTIKEHGIQKRVLLKSRENTNQ